MSNTEDRPDGYWYWKQLIDYIEDPKKIFNGELIYPRQLEIHLPANHKVPCNFHCFYCAGNLFAKDLGSFEMDALDLLRKLDGRIPFIIYGGSYTEPILNPYFMSFLNMTKKTGCHFGIHTNGSLLNILEDTQGFLTELSRIATDKIDYLSVSLDAGSATSHMKTKNTDGWWFDSIIEGISKATKIRDENGGKPAIRMCYLMNKFNSSQEELDNIVEFAKEVKVDSLRFSIPFASYKQDFDIVRKYRDNVEQANKEPYYKKIEKYLSKNKDDKPFIFWMSPDLQDVDLFNFDRCAYGYYQICWGADGYVYRCTTVSAPSFKDTHRIGILKNDLSYFQMQIKANQDPTFCTEICFKNGARCNRMGIEVNKAYSQLIRGV